MFCRKLRRMLRRGGSVTSTVDTTPDAFSFPAQSGVQRSTRTVSDWITVRGINSLATITVTGGDYEIEGGAGPTSAPGIVANGQRVRAGQTSAAGFAANQDTAITIGGVTGTFRSTTLAEDIVPNQFSFAPEPAAALDTDYISNEVEVTLINSASPLAITGGSYSINGGAFVTAPTTVVLNDRVRVKAHSSVSYSTLARATLTIGGVSANFDVTTVAEPPVPIVPVNTVAPTTTAAVIGSAMQLTDGGTWDNSPTLIEVSDWIVNGVDQGASWTPTEAELGQAVQADVRATNAYGSAIVRVSCGVVRRTEPAVSYNFGKRTPVKGAGSSTTRWGKELIKNLSVYASPVVRPMINASTLAPSTWTRDSGAGDGGNVSGTAAHWDWTNVGDGYTPCIAAGQAIDGTYVFRTLATWTDGHSETQLITITAKDGVATISTYDTNTYDSLFKNTLASAVTVSDTVADNAIELAVGFVRSGAPRFQTMQKTKRIIIRNADPLRPAKLGGIDVGSSNNLRFEGIRSTGTTLGQHLLIRTNGVAGSPPSSDIELIDCSHDSGTMISQTTNTGFQISDGIRITVDGLTVRNCMNGVLCLRTQQCLIKNLVVDGFGDNGMNIGVDSANSYGGVPSNDIEITDFLIMRPWRVSGTHQDAIQFADKINGGSIRLKRGIITMAGGNAAMQGIFGGDATAVTSNRLPVDISITGFLADNRGINGFANYRGDNSTWNYLGFVRHNGTALPANSFGADDNPQATGPHIVVGGSNAAMVNGTCTVQNSYAWGNLTSNGGWTVDGATTVAFGLSNTAATPTVAGYFENGDPKAYLDAIPDSVWAGMTADQVKAAVKAAHRPKAGGALAAIGAIDPATGDWRAEVLAA